MTKDEVLAAAQTLLSRCVGYGADGFQAARTDALNYYMQRPRGDEVEGRSTVVAGDLSSSTEANLAYMLEAYTTANVVEFDPLGREDEDQAQLETDTVIYHAMKANNGYMEIATATKDALLQRIAIMKCWAEDVTRATVRTFTDVAPEAVDSIVKQVADNAEIVSYDGSLLVVRADRTQKKLCGAAVSPENFFYPSDYESHDMQNIPACFERHVDLRGRLYELGFKKSEVDKLAATTPSNAARPDAAARDPGGIVAPPAIVAADNTQDSIEWYEGYLLLDGERRRVCFANAGQVLLANERVSLVPYAVGVTLLMPHRTTGISDYDKLRHTQDEHTGLKRSLYDNVNTVTKNRVAAFDGVVSSEDLGDGRTNGTLRVRSDMGFQDIRQTIMAFQVPDNSANILQNIEAVKRERSEAGGAALDLASGQAQIGGERMGSMGLDRAYSVMERLAALKTTTFAQTLLRNYFLLAHATMRENFTDPVAIKINGQWRAPIPAQWPERLCCTVKIGMSPNERARVAAAMEKNIAYQVQFAQLGMEETLVAAPGFYKLLMDWNRVSDLQNPEQWYVDPESDEALKAFERKAQARAVDQQKREALMTQAVGIEQMKTVLDKYIADARLQFDYWNAVLQSQIEEAKIAGNATTELLKAQGPQHEADSSGDRSGEGAPKQ